MAAEKALDPVLERLIYAWADAEVIRDMPELFNDDKLAQIGAATMAAIEEAWQALGHSRRELEDAYRRLLESGKLENWAAPKHVDLSEED
jgi:hypothetical protein